MPGPRDEWEGVWDDVDDAIYAVMYQHGAEGVSTRLLTDEVNARLNPGELTIDFVRSRTARMQRILGQKAPGWGVDSEKQQSSRRYYWFPGTGEVLTNTSYDKIQRVVADLNAIAGEGPGNEELTDPMKDDLRARYRDYFDQLRSTSSPSERERIDAFERQLMAVLNGTKRKHVRDSLRRHGITPMRGWERTWRVLPGNPTLPGRRG